MAEQAEEKSDNLRSLGRRLFEEALPHKRTLHSLAVCLKRLYAAVRGDLTPVFGATGVQTLMTRAVRQAAAHYAFFNQVGVYEDDIDIELAISKMTDRDYNEVRKGFEDIWQSFLGLLADQIGSDLTGALMRQVQVHSLRERSQEDEE